MAYKRADSNNFAEYQLGEGFGAAVTGKSDKTADVARTAKRGAKAKPAGLQGLSGYEGYPEYLTQMGESLSSGNKPNTREVATHARDVALNGAEGMYSFGESDDRDAFAGFDGAGDDAFAGYESAFGGNTEEISAIAKASALDEDEGFDGYGGLGDTPLESFHTYFHKATQAKSEGSLINRLAKAVAAVSDDTPMSVRQEYYNLAREMLQRKKSKSMRHLDTQRVEIESNLGWLVNPQLPKSGGFNAMLDKAVGKVGAKLAKGDKTHLKMQQKMALGKQLKKNISKAGLPLATKPTAGLLRSPFGGLGAFGEDSNTMKYVGFGLAGLALAGVVWYMKNKDTALPSANKKRRKK